ncbi:uroporphyrinogen-III synthase [Folsomia candida]|uniref:Uroporphyrinogen-III synthase n=1 Tax=Folsomia candida TaxID=158441 RepID=A0A226E1T0_FOLCA|nr:uroporphyrinogen-III synthase [Folsomia candida]OXA50871.1 Uroporphyrinogen-III synthase [Folsomia candida]
MKILLFKSTQESQPDKFESALISATHLNATPQTVPVITFNFINLDQLGQKLESHGDYTGIIFSSPRCVSAVEKASQSDPNLVQIWGTKQIFCVGRSTAECASKLFNNSLNIVTSRDENAESLGHQIVQDCKMSEKKSRLLYPCGNLKTGTIQNILTASTSNVDTDTVVVYETVENPQLGQLMSNLSIEEDSPFVFFSPSGLNYAIRHAKEMIVCDHRPLIAIGGTTKDALLKIGGVVDSNVLQCESPSPETLVKCVELIIARR